MYEIIIPNHLWYLPIVVNALIFGTGNTLVHAFRNKRKQIKNQGIHLLVGIIVGATLGACLHFARCIPVAGTHIQNSIIVYILLQMFIGAIGLLSGILNKGKVGVKQALKIFLGLFYFDESSPKRAILQGILRHTWEMPQTFIGQAASHVRNAAGNATKVEYYGGATFVINEHQQYQEGVSLGNYINVNIWETIYQNFDDHIKDNPLLLHEYGHTFDSNLFGWFYLPIIGLPSIHSAMCKGDHQQYWTEKRANRKVKQYAKKYHDIAWDNFETMYPTA